MKHTLFSGIKPTGEAHLGNYLGTLQNWIRLQSNYRCIYAIVDYHALTITPDPDEVRKHTFQLAADLLALGIDPKKTILFQQSQVPEHAELAWIFSCLTPVPELERMTQYKDLTKTHKKTANAGMLMYPVLQAADILLYRATHVPVGEDQIQHLELSRIIARKFNKRYTNYFPEIAPILSDDIRVMSLSDPLRKMSKSQGPKSYIALRDTADMVRSKIAKAVTDSQESSTTLGGGHNLLNLFKHFGTQEQWEQYHEQYTLRSISYASLKKDLAEALITFLRPIQEKQNYYERHPKLVESILADGAERARALARTTMKEIKQIIGLR